MRSRLAVVVVVLSVIATGLFRMLVSAPPVEAQGVTPQLLARYLERSGLPWKRDDKETEHIQDQQDIGAQARQQS